jgi:biotin carboxyl carrier protein
MTFEIEVAGRLRTVSIERAGAGKYRVVLDGEPRLVDAARTGEFEYSLILDGGRNASRTVQVVPTALRGEMLVGVDGQTVAVTINGRHRRKGPAEAGGASDGEQTVVAPMPGRVVRVLVEPGEDVVARQGVVVVEAMKMENELRSPKAGRVKDVSVSPGVSVEAGRVLVTIE